MNRIGVILALVAAVSSACVAGAQGSSAPPSVPCAVFGPGVTCVSPILEGSVDRQWIGLVFRFNGTNGGPDEISVFSIGVGGNGLSTLRLDPLTPDGQFGDRMSATFRHGKLFVSNAIYLPGEAHCCYTHISVRRFGFHNKRLVVEKKARVPVNSAPAQIDRALEKGSN